MRFVVVRFVRGVDALFGVRVLVLFGRALLLSLRCVCLLSCVCVCGCPLSVCCCCVVLCLRVVSLACACCCHLEVFGCSPFGGFCC